MIFNNYGDKNLVILCAGDNPAHGFLQDTSFRKFDLLIFYYGSNPNEFKNKYNNFNFFHEKKGYKFHLIKDFYQENPKFFKKYKNIFIPDDDIIIKNEEINNLFNIFNNHKLILAQPSLIGYYSHKITLHRFEFNLRFTNFVEIMMPCFSSDTFAKCVHTFDQSPIGHGLDYLWPKILDYPSNKIAIIDEIIALHPKKVGESNLYKNNNPEFLSDFMYKNGLDSGKQNVLGKIDNNNFEKSTFDEKFYPYCKTFKNIFENINKL